MENPVKQNSCQKTALDNLKSRLSVAIYGDGAEDDDNILKPRDVVVICFGTPLIAGDAFAPLVAEALREKYNLPCFVYGTPNASVNGKNMDAWMDFILSVHKDCAILAIDASLGEKVGSLVVRKDGVCPAAVKGRKRRIGDVGLLGIVAKSDDDPLVNLMGADYTFVENMALDAAKVVDFCLSFAKER